MQNLVNTYLEKFKQEHHVRRRLTCLLLALAMVVSTGVYWQLHLTGAALTNEVYCGLEEHTHTDDCYEAVLVCTQEESEGHTHTDECYETVTTLVCTLEESEGHTHTEECYDADGSLICTLEESEGHTHTDECYETEQVLVCEQEESEGHTHTDDCYETQLVCTLEEHTHTIDCMVDETADVETADVWEATLPELTGVWADDVVAIATSQLGYTESTANFTLDEDGTTRRGYTRYGAWAGNEYGDWDAMFASFCLYYAGISTEDFPEATGAYAWSVTLQGLGLYASAADDTPLPGDLVFLDADEDGKIDRVGIVTAVAEDGALTVIEGNYAADEDAADAVCETEYAAGSAAVVGYGFLPSNNEAAAVSEDGDESEAEESEVEAEESEVEAEESAVEAEASNPLISVASTEDEEEETYTLASTSTYTELDSKYYELSFTDVTYDNGEVTATLYLDLIKWYTDYYQAAVAAGSEIEYTYVYYIPDVFEDADLTKSLTEVVASNSTLVAYWYEIKYDEDAQQYYVVFYFNEDYFSSGETVSELYFYVSGTVEEWYYSTKDSSDIVIPVDGVEYTIDSEDIDTPDNQSTVADISVTKEREGDYDADTNSITYTIKVSSEKGTNGKTIDLEDVLTVYYGGSSFSYKYIEYSSVTITTSNGNTLTGSDYGLAINDSDGTLTLSNLPALEAGGYYIITYTVYFDTSNTLNFSGTVDNSVTATTDDNGLTDTATDRYNVRQTLLSKSGTDNGDGTITWTITVNSSGVDITGYTLSDTMFSEVTGDITISPSDGAEYDKDTHIITFSATNSDGTNTNTYTITYTTTSTQTLAGGTKVTNKASLNGTEVSVDVTPYNGEVTKSNVDAGAETDADGETTLYWTSTITIPTGGIASGTTILDYLGSGTAYEQGISATKQWYTYTQISELLATYYNSCITFDVNGTDVSVYRNDNGTINYTIEVYYLSDADDDSGDWINYDNLITNASTYENAYFTAWKITFNQNITFDDVATLTLEHYSTTADTSGVEDGTSTSATYTNNVEADHSSGTKITTASYTEYADVVKTDGNFKTGTTSSTISSNALTWYVEVYIPAGSDYDSITITDTLPDGVEVTSISVSTSQWSGYSTVYDSTGWSSKILNYSVDGQVVSFDLPESYYMSLEDSGGYVYIKYSCAFTDSEWTTFTASTTATTLENTVTVTVDGNEYGEDDQTQEVTYKEPDADAISKYYYWNNDTNRLSYSVLLNTDEDTLNGGEDLTFTDDLYTYVNESGYGAYANLINSSVAFYKVTKLTGGSWSTDTETTTEGKGAITLIASGTYTYMDEEGEEVSVEYKVGDSSSAIYVTPLTDSNDVNSATVYLKTLVDISWTYEEEGKNALSSGMHHTITATISDSTAYLVEYVYLITYGTYTGGQYGLELTNTATLTGSVDGSVKTNDWYTETNSGGGASSYHGTLTLTKVDAENYSVKLSGAVFRLYAWDEESQTFKDTEVTLKTDASGQFYFYINSSGQTIISDASGAKYSFAYNTAYYLVEESAPTGYVADTSVKYYFCWTDSTSSTSAYPDNWESLTYYDLTDTSKSLSVGNKAAEDTSIAVKKAWVDENGNALDAEDVDIDSVEVKLYRYTVSSSSSGDSGSSGSSSSDKVTVYWNAGGSGYQSVGTVAKGKEATFTFTSEENATGSWYIGVGGGYWDYGIAYTAYGNGSTGTITIPEDNVTDDIYIYTNSVADVGLPVTKADLTITKTFENAPDTLTKDDVTFTITDSSGTTYTVKYSEMDADGSCTLSVAAGACTITESGADVGGYTRTTTWGGSYTGSSYSVTVEEDGTSVAVTNAYQEGVYVVNPTGYEQVGTETYTLSAANNWHLTIEDLPATDGSGNVYYYYVEEVTASGYKLYSYSSTNSGTNGGTITVTNQLTEEEDTYTLPSAGGVGIWPYAAAGLALCGGAVWLLRRRWLAED